MGSALGIFLVFLWAAVWIAHLVERGFFTLPDWWTRRSLKQKCAILLALGAFCYAGADKTPTLPPVMSSLYRLLYWKSEEGWRLGDVQKAVDDSYIDITNTVSAQAVADAATNEVYTLSFDWHTEDRLNLSGADQSRYNVMARTVWVQPTNILGVLHERHYVAFSHMPSTNPAIIHVEYARQNDDGTVERHLAQVNAESYPDAFVVNLQSGSHTCFWFQVAVPETFANAQRDWNGEALFGSPIGSGTGFDLAGLLLIDDGGGLWSGITTNVTLGGMDMVFENGINVTPTEGTVSAEVMEEP